MADTTKYKARGNVHYIGVSRLKDRLLVASLKHSGSVSSKSVKKVIERDELSVQTGLAVHFGAEGLAWHMLADGQGILYVLVTERMYPERVANDCLEEIKKMYTPLFGEQTLQTRKERKMDEPAKDLLTSIADKYDDLARVDRVFSVQQKVEEAACAMQRNVEAVLEREEKVERIEEQAEKLKADAQLFPKRAGELRRGLWWVSHRQMVVVWALVLVVSLCIVTPIVLRGKQWSKKMGLLHDGHTVASTESQGPSTPPTVPHRASTTTTTAVENTEMRKDTHRGGGGHQRHTMAHTHTGVVGEEGQGVEEGWRGVGTRSGSGKQKTRGGGKRKRVLLLHGRTSSQRPAVDRELVVEEKTLPSLDS